MSNLKKNLKSEIEKHANKLAALMNAAEKTGVGVNMLHSTRETGQFPKHELAIRFKLNTKRRSA